MDIRFDETPAGAQVAIALSTDDLAALGRPGTTVTVTIPAGDAVARTLGVAQLVLSGPPAA